ncbi:MAG: cofactor-independent phosphoglycerate mutase [Planctomycetaceae bacterium]|nr:MAG: cofactor-independent phosphoglycerate mutase [Planctomycetaceae bacterium]
MKYAIIVPDGAADLPIDELGGKTPLQAAVTPNMDWIASHGKCGQVRNVPQGMYPGSDVALLSVMGYDPRQYYTGRAPLEAAAQGLKVDPDEWIFRCNLVTIIDGVMEDHSAGHITTEEGAAIVADLNKLLGGPNVKFFTGVSYRHLLTFRANCDVTTTPPHDILGKKAAPYLPTGAGADLLRAMIDTSRRMLENHDVNVVRRDLGENPATSIWLWGQGKMPQLPTFIERFGLRGASITAVDLIRGLSKLIGWESIEVPGATGYIDTNYAGKGQAAIEAIDRVDVVLVHVEAPDETGHNADVKAKVQAISDIDKYVVGPILKRLQAEGDQWRILVLPDHPTPCSVRTHTAEPVPFAIAGLRIAGVVQEPFSETTAANSDLKISHGHELMEFFLRAH